MTRIFQVRVGLNYAIFFSHIRIAVKNCQTILFFFFSFLPFLLLSQIYFFKFQTINPPKKNPKHWYPKSKCSPPPDHPLEYQVSFNLYTYTFSVFDFELQYSRTKHYAQTFSFFLFFFGCIKKNPILVSVRLKFPARKKRVKGIKSSKISEVLSRKELVSGIEMVN